jgi:hypothetical protein
MECGAAYDVADIRVECQVQHVPADYLTQFERDVSAQSIWDSLPRKRSGVDVIMQSRTIPL